MSNVIYRAGTINDMPAVFSLVQELALFEKAPTEVITSPEILAEDFKKGIFRLLIAEIDSAIVGIALYYVAYSTWKGKMLFLDDLVVTESKRGLGIGRQLLNRVIEDGKKEGVKQIRWQVLEWNTPAIALYQSYKGIFLDTEWITCKLSL